jgi:hypothetical protein
LELERWPPKGIDGLVMRSQPLRAELAIVFMAIAVVMEMRWVSGRRLRRRQADGFRGKRFEGGVVSGLGQERSRQKDGKPERRNRPGKKGLRREMTRWGYLARKRETKRPPPSPSASIVDWGCGDGWVVVGSGRVSFSRTEQRAKQAGSSRTLDGGPSARCAKVTWFQGCTVTSLNLVCARRTKPQNPKSLILGELMLSACSHARPIVVIHVPIMRLPGQSSWDRNCLLQLQSDL